jgi:XapX domain-containing protein
VTALLLGVLMGLAIGAGCRIIDIPLPAPPTIRGALLVVAMTTGYLLGELVR